MKLKKKSVFPVWHAFALLLIAGYTTFFCIYAAPASFRYVLGQMLRMQPHLLILNGIPVLLTGMAFAFFFRNGFFGGAAANLIWGLLALGNRVKIQVRDDPVYPQDLGLLKEVTDAAGSYEIHLPWLLIGMVLASTALCIVLGCCFTLRKSRKRKAFWLRLAAGLASLAALAVLVLTLYASKSLYNSFYCSNFYHISTVYNELGFPYCFCYNATTYQVEKPEGYSRAEAAAWNNAPGAEAKAPDVHVIFVMNEAFSDLSEEGVFLFDEGDDPLKNYHRIIAGDNCLAGHLIVPGFAGGTANTEFDVLTGMQTNMLSPTATSAFRCFTDTLPSLLTCYRDAGYTTSFIHPGNDWFYNRENVYRWMGAEETLFVDEMENVRTKGAWVTDDYVADLIEQRFETAVAAGESLCNVTVTIQNHMSYTADKYGDAAIPRVKLAQSVSGEVQTMVDVYMEGIRDNDAMLGRLTDYFAAQSEPVLLVFWGDHLPYFGDERLGFRELGLAIADGDSAADPFRQYETPYLLWCNDAAAEVLDFADTAKSLDLPANGRISASYLGALTMELMRRDGQSPWFSYLNEARRAMPVYRKNMGYTAGGELFRELPAELNETLTKLHRWTYYKMTE